MASSRNHLDHSIKGSTLEAYPWTETHQVENPIRKQYKILHYESIIVVAGYTHKQQILKILVNCFSNLRMGSTIQFKIKKNGIESHFLLVGVFFFFSFWFIPFYILFFWPFFLPTFYICLINYIVFPFHIIMNIIPFFFSFFSAPIIMAWLNLVKTFSQGKRRPFSV